MLPASNTLRTYKFEEGLNKGQKGTNKVTTLNLYNNNLPQIITMKRTGLLQKINQGHHLGKEKAIEAMFMNQVNKNFKMLT